MRDELGTRTAVAGDDVDHTRRQLGLPDHVAEQQGRERGGLRRLEHDGVPGGERGGDLPGEHQEREVPGDDLTGDAKRPRTAVRERVLELVGPARVVEEVRRGKRKVHIARFANRLATVHRFQNRELARALLKEARDPEEELRALARSDPRPALGIRVARGLHRPIDVGLARLRDLGEGLFARRVDRRVTLLREWLYELASDEEPVALLEMDDLARLGRGRVIPARRDRGGLWTARDIALGLSQR